MHYSGILFDMDGTLIDTVDLYGEAVLLSLEKFGATVTWRQYTETYSMGLHLRELMQKFQIDPNKESDLRNHRDEVYMELLRTKTRWAPGAEAMLDAIKHEKKAIVTGSWGMYVDAINAAVPIRKYFEIIITADHIHHAMKPHPLGLELACQALGVEPRLSVYIGDQPFDIEAARRAGCHSILLRGKYTPAIVPGRPNFEITHLDELLAILE